MGNEAMTISAMTRMLRQIPVVHSSPKNEEVSFGDCVRKASESVADAKNEKTQIAEYRQTLYNKLQSIPYHSSNQLDTTQISISDAGIRRMMEDPDYEKWVTNQVNTIFSERDPWSSLAGGKFIMMRFGEEESDLKITMERAGFPGGQDSMMPKVHKNDDDGFWIRRGKRFEEQMDMIEEMQEKEAAGIPVSMNVMEFCPRPKGAGSPSRL